MPVVRCLTREATSRELAMARPRRSISCPWETFMRNQLKFYFNLAIIGFTVGRAYGAIRRRMARDALTRRRAWS
jgi:hypothetical protein